ncbi:unnamed protein product [Ranitomeya imitator]|uniref:PKD domain-containing protein n=1 Tax=Ranitomeya imitator TaxID=111125 RepID=A0ABN9MPM4_9NEOB|nr:unnamed protein product [Ranitomeya imitator]
MKGARLRMRGAQNGRASEKLEDGEQEEASGARRPDRDTELEERQEVSNCLRQKYQKEETESGQSQSRVKYWGIQTHRDTQSRGGKKGMNRHEQRQLNAAGQIRVSPEPAIHTVSRKFNCHCLQDAAHRSSRPNTRTRQRKLTTDMTRLGKERQDSKPGLDHDSTLLSRGTPDPHVSQENVHEKPEPIDQHGLIAPGPKIDPQYCNPSNVPSTEVNCEPSENRQSDQLHTQFVHPPKTGGGGGEDPAEEALALKTTQNKECGARHKGRRFHDVMEFGRKSGSKGHSNHIAGWSPETNSWDEKLYPAWKSDDSRWENCWRGGKVVALLTSDSPALMGSNITFAVTLRFPRCQRENEDGDIEYERGCGNASSSFSDQYVYNWTKWMDFCDEGNCSFSSNFPDGKPFPHHPHWRRQNFIYIFSTQGQYYQQMGRSSAILSINTTNITAGTQMIEVTVFRRGYRKHYPVAKASSIYIVTDQIPFYVKLSQKNDKNSSDNIFIKDSPIEFDIRIHDPSHYLDKAKLTFAWDYGDGNDSLSNSPVSSHNYTQLGNFSVNLTIRAAIPGPCKPATPTPIHTTLLPTTTSTFTTPFTTPNSTGNSTEFTSFETENSSAH